MINHRISFKKTFSASHTSHETHCAPGRGHGHDFVLEVTAEGGLDPRTGMVRGTEGLWDALVSLCQQVAYKDLNKAVPATDGSLQSIAAWFLDQLQQACPQVVEVRLSNGGQAAATLGRKIT